MAKNFFGAAMGALMATTLIAATPAFAQVVPGGNAPSATVPAAAPYVPPTTAPSPAPGSPPYVLLHGDTDELSRPRVLRIEDAITRYGAETANHMVNDDRNFCRLRSQIRDLQIQIEAAEAELRAAEAAVAAAQNDQQRRIAERRRDRARLNLLDILLGIGSVALAPVTGGGSLAYTGMALFGQGQSQIRRVQGDRDARIWYDQMELYDRRMQNVDRRMSLYDLRMQVYDLRGEAWEYSMGRFCDQNVLPYTPASR